MLTMIFLKLKKYICNKETSWQFATEIINHNIQSFFQVSNWLWRYHPWTTSKWIFLWKTWIYTIQSCSSNNRCRQSTSREKIYREFGLESLKSRRWYRRFSCMFKIMNNEAPNYMLTLIPMSQQTITTSNNQIPNYHCRTNFFKYSFFSFHLKKKIVNLNPSIRNSESLQYSK